MKSYLLIAKLNSDFSGRIIVFCLRLVLIILMVILLSSLYQHKTMKSYRSFWAVYLNEYKTKNEIKDATNEYIDIFSNQTLQVLSDCLLWFIQKLIKSLDNAERYIAKRYYLLSGVENYNGIFHGKKSVNSNTKRYKERNI